MSNRSKRTPVGHQFGTVWPPPRLVYKPQRKGFRDKRNRKVQMMRPR